MGFLRKFPRYDFCCGCIDLRTGVVILGVIGVLSGIYSTFKTFRYMALPELLKEDLIAYGRADHENSDKAVAEMKPLLIAGMVYNLANLVMSSVLLIGAVKRNKKLLAIYLYINYFCIGLLIFLVIIFAIYLAIITLPDDPEKAVVSIISLIIGMTIALFIGLAIPLYVLFCINSYYLLLEEEQNRARPIIQYKSAA